MIPKKKLNPIRRRVDNVDNNDNRDDNNRNKNENEENVRQEFNYPENNFAPVMNEIPEFLSRGDNEQV